MDSTGREGSSQRRSARGALLCQPSGRRELRIRRLRRVGAWWKNIHRGLRYERVLNGFDGYRILELDPRAGRLHLIDKWSSPGDEIYAFFKTLKVEGGGGSRFDSWIEVAELRALCDNTSGAAPMLNEACKKSKD